MKFGRKKTLSRPFKIKRELPKMGEFPRPKRTPKTQRGAQNIFPQGGPPRKEPKITGNLIGEKNKNT